MTVPRPLLVDSPPTRSIVRVIVIVVVSAVALDRHRAIAATIQVAIREYRAYRSEMRALADGDGAVGQVTASAGPASSSASP